MSAAELRARRLSLSIGAARIVHEIDVHVPAGEVVGLLGPNGSGKSTVLKAVYRALRPRAGALLLDGTDLSTLSLRASAQRVAALAQDGAADLDFTVEEVVRLGRSPHQDRGRRLTARELALVDASLERLDVAHLRHRGVLTLSGGERQRLLIARALVQEPDLLVLDERTNHLDIAHQLRLLALLRGGPARR